MAYSAREKLDAVRRELKLRKRVYPRMVEAGRMTASFAEGNIHIFEAIESDYRVQVEAERLL